MRGMTLDETFLIPVQPERYTPDASTTSEYSIHVCARYILITSIMYGILIISQRLAGMEDAGPASKCTPSSGLANSNCPELG